MTRSESKGVSERWVVQAVHIGNPDVTSPASLALLAKKLYTLDRTIYSDFRMKRLRDKWMKIQMKTPDEEGGLTCAICGKKGLHPFTKDEKKRATLDHVHDIGLGGNWNDPLNFQVACYECNSRKNRGRYVKRLTKAKKRAKVLG